MSFARLLPKAVNIKSVMAWDSAPAGEFLSARSMEQRIPSGPGVECRLKFWKACEKVDLIRGVRADNSDGQVAVNVSRGLGWRFWTRGIVRGKFVAGGVVLRRAAVTWQMHLS